MDDKFNELINAHNAGDKAATSELLTLIYAEIHLTARRYMAKEKRGHSLEATDLIGMAYARLEKSDVPINDKAHFISLIAETMRRVLIDHAKKKRRLRNGGGRKRVTLNPSWLPGEMPIDLAALEDALDELQKSYPRQVQVLNLRYFGTLSVAKTAVVLDVSTKTVKNDTQFVKAWLHRRLCQ